MSKVILNIFIYLDPSNKIFSVDKVYKENFRSVYCIQLNKSNILSKEEIEEFYNESAVLLHLLAKHTSFFGNMKHDKRTLMSNKNALFIGTLLTRLLMVISDNAHSVILLYYILKLFKNIYLN